jgi:serine/threonine protein phosphatase PrpC
VQVLIDRGRIREEAVAAHPDRNKIFNCVGAANPPEVDLSGRMALQEGDILLLCSDGLWGPLTRKLITGALLRGDVMKAAPELLDLAEARAERMPTTFGGGRSVEKIRRRTTVPGPDPTA